MYDVAKQRSFDTLPTIPPLGTTYLRFEHYLCRSPLRGGVFLDLLLINSAVKCSVSFSICTRSQWRNSDVANRSTSPNWRDITCLTISCVGLPTKDAQHYYHRNKWCLGTQKYINYQAKRVSTLHKMHSVSAVNIMMCIWNVYLLCPSNIICEGSRNHLDFSCNIYLFSWGLFFAMVLMKNYNTISS